MSNELITDGGVTGTNGDSVIASAQSSRQIAEVQAAMFMAKKFPRDETAAVTKIVNACKRLKLAESSMYSYSKGGSAVTGPSIRLAEALAQAWGNLDFGVIELDQKNGESTVMSYCVDLESNTRQTKVFTVKHERHTRNGSYALSDPRDIYEMTANQGARRLRACILGVIPGDVVDTALEQCEKTLKSGSGEPLMDRIRKMAIAFSEIGVTHQMIEDRLMHKLEAINETELVSLRKIYMSIKDGMGKREEWFQPRKPKETLDDLTERVKGSAKAPKPTAPEPEATDAMQASSDGDK